MYRWPSRSLTVLVQLCVLCLMSMHVQGLKLTWNKLQKYGTAVLSTVLVPLNMDTNTMQIVAQKAHATPQLYPTSIPKDIGKPSPRPYAYSVEWTDPPSLLPRTKIGEQSAAERLSKAEIVLLGEHHNAEKDIVLENKLVNKFFANKGSGITLGMESLQRTPDTQAALDAYTGSGAKADVSAAEAADRLLKAFPVGSLERECVAAHLPVLQSARANGASIVALGVPQSTVKKLQASGLGGLNEEEKKGSMLDADGFLASVLGNGFKKYTDEVIIADYLASGTASVPAEVQQNAAGAGADAIGTTDSNSVNPENFFGMRIFTDESVAATSAQYVVDHPTQTLVIVADEGKVKFGYGLQERAKRNLRLLKTRNDPSVIKAAREQQEMKEKEAALKAQKAVSSVDKVEDGMYIGNGQTLDPSKAKEATKSQSAETAALYENIKADVMTVLMNPMPKDSLSATAQLRLTLNYGPYLDESRPLANYIWYTDFPPIKILTRMKNPINREGQKPPGEASIIGAF